MSAAVTTIWPPLPIERKLFNIEPLGTGETICEALTSWLVRLAEKHRCRPRVLITDVIAPATRLSKDWSGDRRKFAFLMNGSTRCAIEVTQAIRELSGTDTVKFHSLAFLADVLDSQGKFVLEHRRKWCNVCLRDQISRGEPVHDHLYWSLRTVELCAIHLTKLRSTCQHCGLTQSHIPLIPSLQICEQCGCELIDAADEPPSPWAEADAYSWHARSAAGLIKAGHALGPARYETFRSNLQYLLETHADGSVTRLARSVGLRENILRNWFRKNARPSFTPLAEFCYRIRIPPEVLILHDTLALTHSTYWTSGPDVRYVQRGTRTTRAAKESYAQALKWALSRPISERPTLKALATKLGVSVSLLSYAFPTDVGKLTDSTRQRLASEAMTRTEVRLGNRRAAEGILRSKGLNPSQRRLKSTGLVKPSDLRRKNSDKPL